jgi:hypothetical protein
MIFDCLNHHCMLQVGPRNLHSTARAYAGVRDIAITTDFVRCVHDDDPLYEFSRKDARALAQQCGFSDAGPAQ